jgi:hypothetical protein
MGGRLARAAGAGQAVAGAGQPAGAGETGDYTFYYGLAGLGMTNLRFYLRDHDENELAAALVCARAARRRPATSASMVFSPKPAQVKVRKVPRGLS